MLGPLEYAAEATVASATGSSVQDVSAAAADLYINNATATAHRAHASTGPTARNLVRWDGTRVARVAGDVALRHFRAGPAGGANPTGFSVAFVNTSGANVASVPFSWTVRGY